MTQSEQNKHDQKGSHHHILPYRMVFIIGACLMVLTVVTVGIAKVDLGHLNFFVAMLVATIKAALVAVFFMALKYDKRENSVIFATSFLFLAIFLVLTSTDLFFRGDVYVKPGALTAQASTKSKLKDPWISTPKLVSHGKELYTQNCATCHGAEGRGDGIAAAGLVPKPRNFHEPAGWKNGRKPSEVFKTLKEGIPGTGMASFASLPSDDRWALTHYVLTMGATPPPADTAQDLAKAGLGAGAAEEAEAPSISVELAMERMTVPGVPVHHAVVSGAGSEVYSRSPGAQLYVARCASCHGLDGAGGVRVLNSGLNPRAFVTTRPLRAQTTSLKSAEAFNKVVLSGLPGEIMPGFGQLSGAELTELFGYVRSLGAAAAGKESAR